MPESCCPNIHTEKTEVDHTRDGSDIGTGLKTPALTQRKIKKRRR
jgi:hypothetical protein